MRMVVYRHPALGSTANLSHPAYDEWNRRSAIRWDRWSQNSHTVSILATTTCYVELGEIIIPAVRHTAARDFNQPHRAWIVHPT